MESTVGDLNQGQRKRASVWQETRKESRDKK